VNNDVNAMVIRVNKRRIYSKRQADPFRHEYSSSDIIEPPYSFYDLVTFVEMSSILPQAIDAVCQNCKGFGHNLLAAKMTKDEREKYAEAIVTERDEINAFFDCRNYDMSFTALRKKLRSDYETIGNAFFEVLRNKSGRIDGCEYLKGITMRLAGLSTPVLSEVRRIKPDAWK
jgi:capsid portal protein